jgi:hypothetical protein
LKPFGLAGVYSHGYLRIVAWEDFMDEVDTMDDVAFQVGFAIQGRLVAPDCG